MAWRDLSVDRKKRLRTINRERSASVVTDENGWYRICGVPTGTWVSMQIQGDKRSGPVLRTRVDDTLGSVDTTLKDATAVLTDVRGLLVELRDEMELLRQVPAIAAQVDDIHRIVTELSAKR